MRILVVEDSVSLGESLVMALKAMDHSVDHVADGSIASSVLKTEQFDLVTLDLNLPGMDGLDILKNLRASNRETPVLILTMRDSLDERVRGLDLGADDYMTKPFDIAEFEARIRCLLRRKEGMLTNMIEFGPLIFNTTDRTAVLDNLTVELTRRERSLLEILLSRAGRVIPKDSILEQLCSFDDDMSASAIETYIHRLRKKISHPDLSIRTVRGLGYMLEHG